MTSSQPTQPLTDEGPASDRDKDDMVAARREIQAVLDGRLPMDNAAYSAAIVMVLWKAGWRPRHLSTSMDRCDIADGWWRLGQGWRQKYNEAQSEVDRLRAELDEAHRTAGAEHGRAAALEAAYRETCTARDARDTEIERLRAETTAQAEQIKELASAIERPAAEPDEEFDAVREAALKWAGGKEVKDLLDAFDWLRSELAYSERIKDYVRKQCGKLRAELDSMTRFAEDLREERDRRLRAEGERGVERDALAAKIEAAAELHPAWLCETCNSPGPCLTRRRLGLDQDGEGQANGAA